MLSNNPNSATDIELRAKHLVKYISRACDAAMVRKKHDAQRKSAYWWNTEIEGLRTECQTSVETSMSKGTVIIVIHKAILVLQKNANKLKKAIKKRKADCSK